MTDKSEWPSRVFARRVRQMREAREWSQAELGRRVGLGQSRIAAIEATGQRAGSRPATVNIDQAVTFAQVLSVPVEILLFEHLPSDAAVSTQRLVKILQKAESVQQSIEWLREDWAGFVSTVQALHDSPAES